MGCTGRGASLQGACGSGAWGAVIASSRASPGLCAPRCLAAGAVPLPSKAQVGRSLTVAGCELIDGLPRQGEKGVWASTATGATLAGAARRTSGPASPHHPLPAQPSHQCSSNPGKWVGPVPALHMAEHGGHRSDEQQPVCLRSPARGARSSRAEPCAALQQGSQVAACPQFFPALLTPRSTSRGC